MGGELTERVAGKDISVVIQSQVTGSGGIVVADTFDVTRQRYCHVFIVIVIPVIVNVDRKSVV